MASFNMKNTLASTDAACICVRMRLITIIIIIIITHYPDWIYGANKMHSIGTYACKRKKIIVFEYFALLCGRFFDDITHANKFIIFSFYVETTIK